VRLNVLVPLELIAGGRAVPLGPPKQRGPGGYLLAIHGLSLDSHDLEERLRVGQRELAADAERRGQVVPVVRRPAR
jgi:hypothetical protein